MQTYHPEITLLLFSIFYIIFIQSMNIKNNDSSLLERSIENRICYGLFSLVFFWKHPVHCTDHLQKKTQRFERIKNIIKFSK